MNRKNKVREAVWQTANRKATPTEIREWEKNINMSESFVSNKGNIRESVERVFGGLTEAPATDDRIIASLGGTDLGVGFFGGHYDSRGGSWWVVAKTHAEAEKKLITYWRTMYSGEDGIETWETDAVSGLEQSLKEEIEIGPIHLVTNIDRVAKAFSKASSKPSPTDPNEEHSDILHDINYGSLNNCLLMRGNKALALLVWEGDLPNKPKGCNFEETIVGEDAWGMILLR